jgi:group I intron endonuclease
MEAFVYCWTDKKTNKLYIGSHKGSINDGYICSSKPMKEEYTKRPQDFSREIIASGSLCDIRTLESAILKSVDAKSNNLFYNMHNNNGLFILSQHTEKTKQKMRNSKLGKSRSKNSIEKQRNTILGKNNPFFGKSHSEEFKKRQSERQRVNQVGGKNNNAIIIKYKDAVFETMKDMVSSTGISYYNIKKMIARKEVEMI